MATQPKIIDLQTKQLVGLFRPMTLAQDETGQLWQSFMPRRNEVSGRLNKSVISMQVYTDFENRFLPESVFTKWAAVEVAENNVEPTPQDMSIYMLEGGTYAVFAHKGPASDFPRLMQSIFVDWMPNSGYKLADREHFEVLPEGYIPTDRQAQEDVWIPVELVLD